MGYERTIKLKHNERAAKIDMETGNVTELPARANNMPEGKSKLDYDRYHISNDRFIKQSLAAGLLNNEELGIITHMSSIAEINTNSLRPLDNDTTAITLGEKFGVNRKKIKTIFDKFFKLGVFMQLNYYSYSEDKNVTYWVLNPNISWKGRLKDDSIFLHFRDTIVSKMLSWWQIWDRAWSIWATISIDNQWFMSFPIIYSYMIQNFIAHWLSIFYTINQES